MTKLKRQWRYTDPRGIEVSNDTILFLDMCERLGSNKPGARFKLPYPRIEKSRKGLNFRLDWDKVVIEVNETPIAGNNQSFCAIPKKYIKSYKMRVIK